MGNSDVGHYITLNSAGRHGNIFDSTGGHCPFLKSTCDTSTPYMVPHCMRVDPTPTVCVGVSSEESHPL